MRTWDPGKPVSPVWTSSIAKTLTLLGGIHHHDTGGYMACLDVESPGPAILPTWRPHCCAAAMLPRVLKE